MISRRFRFRPAARASAWPPRPPGSSQCAPRPRRRTLTRPRPAIAEPTTEAAQPDKDVLSTLRKSAETFAFTPALFKARLSALCRRLAP